MGGGRRSLAFVYGFDTASALGYGEGVGGSIVPATVSLGIVGTGAFARTNVAPKVSVVSNGKGRFP